ncbi:MAG: hypothetical protein LIO90_03230 [Bacteroidales bacterium]|nr:hypothetical protein [Bacteroidales bacterium]
MKVNASLLSAGLAVLVSCGVGITAYNSMTAKAEEEIDAQLLENLEALTSTEDEIVKCYCRKKSENPDVFVCSTMGDISYCGGDPCINHDANCR